MIHKMSVFLLVVVAVCKAKDWKALDLTNKELPDNLALIRNKVDIDKSVENIAGVDTYIQLAEPPAGVEQSEQVVLLLHGAAFSSQTWVDRVPTIATLAALGHSVIAVDLPGFGKTRSRLRGDRGEYLSELIDTLTPEVKPVVVTPSMSGGFIFPFLKKYPEKISGWVPVAPSFGSSQTESFYKSLALPTMIVYGDRDSGAARAARLMSVMPNSTLPQVLPNSGHPAYRDQPELWHKLLQNFLIEMES